MEPLAAVAESGRHDGALRWCRQPLRSFCARGNDDPVSSKKTTDFQFASVFQRTVSAALWPTVGAQHGRRHQRRDHRAASRSHL